MQPWEMEVCVLVAEGAVLNPQNVLSVRAGSSRRQGAVQVGKNLRFPVTVKDAAPFKVDLLGIVGAGEVDLLPDDAIYTIPILPPAVCEAGDGGPLGAVVGQTPMQVRLRVANKPSLCGRARAEGKDKVRGRSLPAPASKTCEGAVPELGKASALGKLEHEDDLSLGAAAVQARRYFEDHNVMRLMQALLEALVREQPAEPFTYIATFMDRLSTSQVASLKAAMAAGAVGVRDPTADRPQLQNSLVAGVQDGGFAVQAQTVLCQRTRRSTQEALSAAASDGRLASALAQLPAEEKLQAEAKPEVALKDLLGQCSALELSRLLQHIESGGGQCLAGRPGAPGPGLRARGPATADAGSREPVAELLRMLGECKAEELAELLRGMERGADRRAAAKAPGSGAAARQLPEGGGLRAARSAEPKEKACLALPAPVPFSTRLASPQLSPRVVQEAHDPSADVEVHNVEPCSRKRGVSPLDSPRRIARQPLPPVMQSTGAFGPRAAAAAAESSRQGASSSFQRPAPGPPGTPAFPPGVPRSGGAPAPPERPGCDSGRGQAPAERGSPKTWSFSRGLNLGAPATAARSTEPPKVTFSETIHERVEGLSTKVRASEETQAQLAELMRKVDSLDKCIRERLPFPDPTGVATPTTIEVNPIDWA